MTEKPYSVFIYQYGEADNVSPPGKILLHGNCDETLEAAMRAGCECGEFFVAEQIGVPTLYAELYKLSGGPTIDDVAFHEFLGLRLATAEEASSLPRSGQLDDFAGRFFAVRYWDCTLSPHCR